MNQITDFFRGIFSINEWPARWYCGNWTDFHGWLYIVSDLMIWLAYCLMPVIIINYFTKKKGLIKFQKVYLLFAAFILLCGTTHLFDALMFWIPMYRLNALVRFVTGIVSLMTVYSLIKLLPEAFKQKTNVELETEIERRKEVERKLEIANRELENFAAIASHDLQEPIRNISIFSSMLEKNIELMDEKGKGYLEKINTSTLRMQVLIKEILTLSSLKKTIDLSPVNLKEVMKNVYDGFALRIKETNAHISYDDLGVINGNAPLLNQVFFNLINNSLKFCKQSPIIKITSNVHSGNIIINISDNGIGIDNENFSKIFNAFERLHSKSEYEGTGLGLSICKRIVELHHGKITVHSEINIGTTFKIIFPMYSGIDSTTNSV